MCPWRSQLKALALGIHVVLLLTHHHHSAPKEQACFTDTEVIDILL
jgi:hypothetical protein